MLIDSSSKSSPLPRPFRAANGRRPDHLSEGARRQVEAILGAARAAVDDLDVGGAGGGGDRDDAAAVAARVEQRGADGRDGLGAGVGPAAGAEAGLEVDQCAGVGLYGSGY